MRNWREIILPRFFYLGLVQSIEWINFLEETNMTSRNLVKLFFSTLLIGGIATGILGFIVRWDEFQPYFLNFQVIDIIMSLFWLVGVGLIFSVLSQMGFAAYLTVHRFGLGIFKSHKLWNSVQIIVILFVLFDLVYLRFTAFSKPGDSIIPYITMAIFVLISGLVVAYVKAKQTNKEAFIPAVFFMVVVTTLEWVPVLRVNEQGWVYLMLFSLLICNAYQLLILHKLNEKSTIELQQKKKINNQNPIANGPKKLNSKVNPQQKTKPSN
jgi:KinB signaling pathway activation protein